MRAEEADMDLKLYFFFPVFGRSFFIENTMEEKQKMGPRKVHMFEARADAERTISHFVFKVPFPFFLTKSALLAIKIVCL